MREAEPAQSFREFGAALQPRQFAAPIGRDLALAGKPGRAFEEPVDADAVGFGQHRKTVAADAVDTFLVFLHLLERDVDQHACLFLGEVGEIACRTQPRGNVIVDFV